MPTATRLACKVFRAAGFRAAQTVALALGLVLASALSASASKTEPSPLSLYGLTGIIDTPSARMMQDGDLAITGEAKKPDDRITIAFQALPWLETTARYTINNNFSGPGQTEYDRSLGFKAGLMTEGRYRPALAVGLMDIGGTEFLGGEYFVASKRFGPFDASLGLGFGRLGSVGMFSNPLGIISKKFYDRPGTATINDTGQVAFKDFFRGRNSSLFGGIVYNTPIKGLQLLAEYSGDKYASEQAKGLLDVRSQVNVGASYRPFRFLELGAYWTYGSQFAFRISLKENLITGDQGPKLDPPPVPIHVRTDDEILQGRLSNPLDINPKPTSAHGGRAQSALGLNQVANGPDWTLDDGTFAAPVFKAAYRVPEPQDVNASQIARIKARLESLDMSLANFGVDDVQAVISVVPRNGQAPLPCEVMWQQVPVDDLIGINAVTFVNSAGGREINRCTKFIDHSRTQVADSASQNADASASLASNAEDPKVLADRIRRVLAYQGLVLEAFKLNGSEALVYLDNVTYQRVGRALGRAARALTALLPPKVDMITIIESNGAITGDKFSIPRTELERVAETGGSAEEILAASSVSPAKPRIVANADYERSQTLRFSPILAPAFRQSLFDPDNPFRYQFLIRAGGTLQIFRGLALDGVYDINLYNNFDTIKRVSDSVLPHVRSDFRYYLQQGSSGIESLQLVLTHQFAPAWTTRLSVGYLEQMYGGVAGEILYAPFRQRWAFGLDVAAVKQRDFNELFGFRHYQTVTGHLSLYYQTPFHNIDLHLLYGRYLARDWGTTIEVSRRFDNGAEVAAYATFTNVPFSKFGEGSFDKGIRITIPFDFYSLFSSRQASTIEFKPVTRDGGAILNDWPKLYPIVRSFSYGDAYRTFDDFLDDH